MRRTLLAAVLLGCCTGAVGIGLSLSSSPARSSSGPAASSPADPLPIGEVILYSSGVGYFQRQGTVEGNARVDLTFPVQDINDLLKSMVLQDLDGGQINAVSYDSQAPIDRTLKSFAIDLTSNPSFAQVLTQARGEKVEVVSQSSGAAQPGTLTGSIVGVETQKQPAGKDSVVEVQFLNLWCAEGLRSVKLSEVQRLRFLNPVMDSEVKKALEVLALSHDTQKKAVSLNFTGQGRRQVQVGYVVANPIWKTSYRLVLGKHGKPALQGWAIVENTSDDDWNGVRMALISGRPISFRMDLYQPLYVPRPVVEPELFASLRPPTYNGNLIKSREDIFLGRVNDAEKQAIAVHGFVDVDGSVQKFIEATKGERQPSSAALDANAVSPLSLPMSPSLDLQKGVQSSATATSLGDYFKYRIDHPVSLPRQKSALLPIVNQEVEGTRVSIYNESVQAKHPLLGLKFKNTTGLHLTQGPITVFESSSYAGDARILDLQPKEERLLSYAIDLGTEVEAVVKNAPERVVAVKITRGVVTSTAKTRETKTYTVKNRSEQDRTLLIEHPYRADVKLVSPEKPAERARDVYRFELKVPAGKPASLEVVEERDRVQIVTLTNSDEQTMRVFLKGDVLTDPVKAALNEALAWKGKLATTQRELELANKQLADIVSDQDRLRANLKEMPATSQAYKRYLKKFDDQETEIEQLRGRIKQLQETEKLQRTDYEEFLSKLTVE
jgi:hypothetical protein